MIASRYLDLIPFAQALQLQESLLTEIRDARSKGVVLGFEAEPVITLGVRTGQDDASPSIDGFQVMHVDRGGQATLHNPGQLVVFPVLSLGQLGVRDWICLLVRSTQRMARGFGQTLHWNESMPGLYSEQGKVVAIGVRVRRGISTHGLAINLCNDLRPFSRIRACGRLNAQVAHLGVDRGPGEVFSHWLTAFQAEVDNLGILAQFTVLA